MTINLAKFPDLDHVPYPYAGAIAINIGDLVFEQSGSVVPASSLAATGNQAADATTFVPSFAGVARECKSTSDAAGSIDVTPFWVGDIVCPSTVWQVGDLVTISEASDIVLDQQVQFTADTAAAIGVCVQDSGGVATTTVRVYIESRTTPMSLSGRGALFSEGLSLGDGGNVVLGSSVGSVIATSAAQKLAFFAATPIAQPSGAAQAALANSTGGSASGTLTAVGATNSGDVSATINNNFADLWTQQNAIRSALVELGLMKGSA